MLAILNRRDVHHDAARATWERLLTAPTEQWTGNYVLLEASAITQSRAGMDGLRALHVDLLPVLHVARVDEAVHHLTLEAVLAANRRGLRLVDAVSFHVMRRPGLGHAFALDPHFEEQGFAVVT